MQEEDREVNRYLGITLGIVLAGLLAIGQSFGQTATLMPNAVQQFFDNNGKPLATGTVGFYTPNTLTLKNVWSDSTESTLQTNPVPLTISGRPAQAIYGDGVYRQIVKDHNGATIWDAVTTSTGGSGGGAVASSQGVMVGTVIAWTNPVLPPKYLYAQGQAISRSTFSDLYNALVVPQVILCQTGIGTLSVPTTVSDILPIGAPIEAACFAPGTTVTAKSSGSLTFSSNATATQSVLATFFPWGNGNGSTTFNIPEIRGRIPVGRNNMNGGAGGGFLSSTYYGVNPNALNAGGGNESQTLTLAQLPTGIRVENPNDVNITVNSTVNDVIRNSGGTVTSNATAGGNSQLSGTTPPAPQTIVSTGVVANHTMISFSVNTNGTPHPIIQPSVTVDYIIKALPDDSPTGPGVSSIQGMTGAIACGTGVTCSANTITATGNIAIGVSPVISGTVGGILYTGGGGILGNSAAITALVLGNGTSAPSAYGGSNCTNQFPRAISGTGVFTCQTVTLTADVTGVLPVANGGTAGATALAARASGGLNIDQSGSTGDANGTIGATDRAYYHTALSAARTDTLPAANALNVGQRLLLWDPRGVATVSNTVTVQRAGADTVNGGTTFVALNVANSIAECVSDGVSRWGCQQFGVLGGGGFSSAAVTGTSANIAATGTCSSSTAINCNLDLSSARKTLPTSQSLVASSGTYTTPANVLWLEIFMIGGSGGGGGTGSAGGFSAGGNGGDTCWNTSGSACATPVYSAGGGAGGAVGSTTAGANGGVGGNGGSPAGSATPTNSSTGSTGQYGAAGVAATFTGRGGLGASSSCGIALRSNGGDGGSGITGGGGGGGGGSGACLYTILNGPAASYTFTNGAAGAAGVAGTGGNVGNVGVIGKIVVIEHYGT